jgi:hypothetical protein
MDTFATLLATYVRTKLADVQRAALLVRCTHDGSLVAAVFGNDNFSASMSSRREVELLRQHIRDASLNELAFGISMDGHAWTLLVKADNQGFQTAVGKAFRTEMLRASLDEAVWAAWRTACGGHPDEAGWSALDALVSTR